jgi:hypothetical protein
MCTPERSAANAACVDLTKLMEEAPPVVPAYPLGQVHHVCSKAMQGHAWGKIQSQVRSTAAIYLQQLARVPKKSLSSDNGLHMTHMV